MAKNGERACPNCGQWQRLENDGDCVNECALRGFAPRYVPEEKGWIVAVREIASTHSAACIDKETGECVGRSTMRFPSIGQKVWAATERAKEQDPLLCEVVGGPNGCAHSSDIWELRLPDGSYLGLEVEWIFPTFVIVDATTASMLCSIYDLLKPKNRDKFGRMDIMSAVDLGWKLINKTRS